jgi:hypothetical protein
MCKYIFKLIDSCHLYSVEPFMIFWVNLVIIVFLVLKFSFGFFFFFYIIYFPVGKFDISTQFCKALLFDTLWQ